MRVLLLLLWFGGTLAAKPLSVVIVGGGPAGLAAAIEAQQAGAQVIIVEKRATYTRKQVVFLFEDAVDLLDKWSVKIPTMSIVEIDEDERLGIVMIRDLEAGLAQRALDLGIAKLFGTFDGLIGTSCSVKMGEGSSVTLPFDLLIGADGTHSCVRQQLGIPTLCMGSASGAVAILDTDRVPSLSIDTEKLGGLYMRRMTLPPQTRLILAQSTSCSILTQEHMGTIARRLGWEREAELLEKGEAATFITEIPILLQQAERFSDEERCALLIGDAAGVGSFFQGKGIHIALRTSALVGQFIHELQEGSAEAYQTFDRGMRALTDLLIVDSRYLFCTETP